MRVRWVRYWTGEDFAIQEVKLQQHVGDQWIDVPEIWEGTGDDDTPPEDVTSVLREVLQVLSDLPSTNRAGTRTRKVYDKLRLLLKENGQ